MIAWLKSIPAAAKEIAMTLHRIAVVPAFIGLVFAVSATAA